MYILLSDTDRKTLGIDAEIYWENSRFTNREARLVERPEPDGPGLSPEQWIEACVGEIVEIGGVPQIDDETGEPYRRPTAATLDVVIWLGLRRAGIDVSWSDFEYDRNGLVIRPDHEPEPDGEPESGKDEPAVEDSPTPS
jgi:hypothetical protein